MGFAAAGLLFTGAAAGLQVYSQLQAGKTAETVAAYNDGLASQEAANREAEFREAAKRESMTQRKTMAELRAQFSTQGTALATGTPISVLGEVAANFQTRLADAGRATAMETASLRQQGKMGLWEASLQKRASTIGAVGTTIGAVSKAVSAYGHNRYTGAF